MSNPSHMSSMLSHKVRRLSHLDLPGGGQVVVQGRYAYVGHMKPPHGTTIIDVSDPRQPRVLAELKLDGDRSHSHKVRVTGDIMVTNVEHSSRRLVRRLRGMLASRSRLERTLGRLPTGSELAADLRTDEAEIAALEAEHARGYGEGGFKIWDISDPLKPRLLSHQKTGGCGVHRFDSDENYAYISTEMEGYSGNILVIYDIRDRQRPSEVSRYWLPGQHAAGGEQPTWDGGSHMLHHALRYGNQLWAAFWYGGFRVLDVSDMTQPRVVGACNYHPPAPYPTHTVLRVPFKIDGRDVAVGTDEEHEHHRGQPHAGFWVFDVTDLHRIQAIGQFHLSEMDSPWSRAGGRFGAHQFQEHMRDTLAYTTWFAGGLRIIDIRNPRLPEEVAWYIPEPRGGFASPQSNDVDVDPRGLIYLLDRNCGFDILEFSP